MILCLTGMPGSGKSTAAEIFAKRGFEVREMSSIIKAEMAKRKIELNPESLEAFTNKMKAEHGKDVWAVVMGKGLVGVEHNVLVVGFRSIAEFETVERSVGMDLPLIMLYAPQKVRFNRISTRPVLPIKDPDKFLSREKSNIDMGILDLRERADYLVSNTGSKEEFAESIEELIKIIAKTD